MDASLSVLVRDAEQFHSSSDGLRDGGEFLAVHAPDVRRAGGVRFVSGGEACVGRAREDEAVGQQFEHAALFLFEAARRQAEGRLCYDDDRSYSIAIADDHQGWRESRGPVAEARGEIRGGGVL